MISSLGVLIAALWISALVGALVGVFSISAGASATWVVLRSVGAFSAFMALGLVAEAITRYGLSRPVPMQMPGAGNDLGALGMSSVRMPTLEPEILTASEAEEESDDAA